MTAWPTVREVNITTMPAMASGRVKPPADAGNDCAGHRVRHTWRRASSAAR